MTATTQLTCGDCLEVMRGMQPASVDLVFGSPPYENARTYGIDFDLKGQEWVDWMVEVVKESLRVCRGLVAYVVEGRTQKFRWSATPTLLMADLHRAGIHLRKPPIYRRVGIPGSGGPDWLRNDYEFIVCATNGGKLSWSDNTAMGHEPKWMPGGALSHRMKNGRRVDKLHTKNNGNETITQGYTAPKLANPGNIIHCQVGGGRMGSNMAHENEAPFPENLAEYFIRSFCQPGGIVLDPFSGSGTTVAVAERLGRIGIGIDIRQSQIDLTRRRLQTIQRELVA
jgi:DNA modification methylase